MLTIVDAVVDGKVITEPEIVTSYGDRHIFCVLIVNKRNSGAEDTFCVHYSDALGVVLKKGLFISAAGDIRTLNESKSDSGIGCYINARGIRILDEEPSHYENTVVITNVAIDRFIEVRKSYTDASKTVAVYRIKLPRNHDRYSYLKVTSWGKDAFFVGNSHETVKSYNMKCRLQSYRSKGSGTLYFSLVTFFVEAC